MNKTIKPSWITEPKKIQFKPINRSLQGTYEKMTEKLQSDRKDANSFYAIASNLVLISHQTYRSICKLVDHLRVHNTREVYAFQAMILSRTLMDTFFIVVGLTENPKENALLYAKAGYRDDRECYEKIKNKYTNNPNWRDWIREKEASLGWFAESLGLSDREKLNPKEAGIPYWPNPYQLVNNTKSSKSFVPLSDEKLNFLKQILELRYDESSSWSHMGLQGLAVGVISAREELQWQPEKVTSDAIYSAIIFSLMILSEIEIECRYSEKKTLRNLWEELSEGYDEVKEYYEFRYKKALL